MYFGRKSRFEILDPLPLIMSFAHHDIAVSNLSKADSGFSNTSADLVGSSVLLNHTGRGSVNFKVFSMADK